jgi:hypothetical protein
MQKESGLKKWAGSFWIIIEIKLRRLSQSLLKRSLVDMEILSYINDSMFNESACIDAC